MRTEIFEKAWQELSDIQRTAAGWNSGPLLVLAGPGSGKTRVLTCRIARILEESPLDNFRILGLTFTNKAADEMRQRVMDYVPGKEDRFFLGTFHSFCANALRQHGVHLGINPNFQIYSQTSDLQAILDDAVEIAKQSSDLVSDLDKKTLPVIKRLKSLLFLPDECCDLPIDVGLKERISIVYPAYEEQLAKRNALDFESLILRTYQLFDRYSALAKRYRAVYEHICVDEFQDTNIAQYKLLRALTGAEFKNLFVVADDDQIIYQWNGASHKRLDELVNDYSPQVLQLPVNYRCPPEIVELANNLIQYNFLRRPDKKPIEASQSRTGHQVVRLLGPYETFEEETATVAQVVAEKHSDHLESVVVLARSRRALEYAQTAFRNGGIKTIIAQRKDEFQSTPFLWLYSVLRLANDRQNRACFETMCGAFSQLTDLSVDLENIIAQANASNRDYLQHWIRVTLEEALSSSDPISENVIRQTEDLLSEKRDFKAFSDFALDWFGGLVKGNATENGSEMIFADYYEELEVWQQLTSDIIYSLSGKPTLEAFLQELQMRSKEPVPKQDTLVLMTIHGAKGKEFDHVYLIGLVDDELPSYQSKQKGDHSPEMEEERRNCFVAITRASRSLTLSYYNKYKGWLKSPSRFLVEMGLLDMHQS